MKINRRDQTTRSGKGKMGWKVRNLPLLLAVGVLLPPLATSEESMQHRVSPHRISESIKVDGIFDETAWQSVEPIRQFLQIQPIRGAPMTQPSEARILYDATHLYFGFTFFDAEMDKLVANVMRRDSIGLWSNDYGFLLLDTYNDRRTAVFFRFNPLGGMEDTAVSNSGDSLNTNWDIVWECRARINPENWTAEIAIPFSQLRFEQSDVMTWGMNFGRQIARNQEIGAWKPAPKTYGAMGMYRTAYFGSLTGLEDIVPSRDLEFLPYITAGSSREAERHAVLEAGLDLKYGITPNLTADLTLNTDFAQVEADSERVNLTRFDLFFPEQRPFFLEGAGTFDVGIPRPNFFSPPPLLLFYSRRIGLAEERAIPIIAGGKITGKVGAYGVGVLDVLTDEFQDDEVTEPRTNYSVLRLTRDVFSGSSVGVIAINKQSADAYNRTAGFDVSYKPRKDLTFRGLWSRTFDDEVTEQDSAFYLGGDWRGSRFHAEGSYTDIGDNFDPEVGFVSRVGMRHLRGKARYRPWPEAYGVRQVGTGPTVELVLNRDNELETRNITYDGEVELKSGDWMGIHATHTTELLTEEFEIEDAVVPSGHYEFTRFGAYYFGDSSRKVFSILHMNFGEFYHGTSQGVGVETVYKPNARLSIHPMLDWNRISFPSGTFNASVFAGRMSYSFSTTLYTKLFAQWSSDRDAVSANFLINYIYRPGSDFYLVVNQTYDAEGEGIDLRDWTIVGKVTYWWLP